MCVSVKSDSSLQNLLHNHCNGWFFAICEKTLNIIKNNILPNSVMCNPFQQDSNKVHTLDGPLLQTNSCIQAFIKHCTKTPIIFLWTLLCKQIQAYAKPFSKTLRLLIHLLAVYRQIFPLINDNSMNIGTVTKSSVIAYYGTCFSLLKPCSYWKSQGSK